MKRQPFPVGSLVVNTGRLRGQGYIWRVEGYVTYQSGQDRRTRITAMVCRNIGPLHGKPEPHDYHIGGRFLYRPEDKELLGNVKPACQLNLI